MAKVKTDSIDEKVFTTKGSKLDEATVLSTGSSSASSGFDPHFITEKIIEFGMALTGMPLYEYQKDSAYRIIHSIVAKEGETITMLFSRQCFGKGTMIQTYDFGKKVIKPIEDIKNGDYVVSPNNLPVEVKDYHSGTDELYLIIPQSDFLYRPYVVNSQHLIAVYDLTDNAYKNISVEEYISIPIEHKMNLRGYARTVDFTENALYRFNVIPNGKRAYYGFEICDDTGLFLLPCNTVVMNSGKSETMAFVIDTLCVILPILGKVIPELSEYTTGFRVGLFAPQSDQVTTTYQRALSRLKSSNATMIMEDSDIETKLLYDARLILSNGSSLMGQTAAKTSKIESKTYDLVIIEEAQDTDDLVVSKCFHEDTKMLQADGTTKTIKEVVENNLNVIAYTDNQYKEVTPIEYHDNGARDVYEIVTANGKSIKLTDNHKVYVNRRTCRKPIICKVSELRPNDRLCTPSKIDFFGEYGTYEMGAILGYIIGNGCITGSTHKKSAILYSGFYESIRHLESILAKAFPTCGIGKEIYQSNGMATVSITTNTELLNWLIELGLYGCGSKDKHLPNLPYSKEFLRGLFCGLIETDGCVTVVDTKDNSPCSVRYASISKKLCESLQHQLLKFGISAGITVKVQDYSKSTLKGIRSCEINNPLYEVHVADSNSVRTFYNEFTLIRKQGKLNQLFKKVEHKGSKNSALKYPDTVRFYQIKSITNIGKANTYCITINTNEHLVVADGFIVHNSIESMTAACVHVDTVIKLLHGKKVKAKDVVVGDVVRGYDFTKGSISYGKVSWCQPPCKKVSYRLTFSNGTNLLCSFDHPILVRRNGIEDWVETENLTVDSYVRVYKSGVLSVTKLLRKDLIGEIDVANFTVDGINTYLANGIVTHNTFGTLVKLGTTGMKKGDFWYEIQRNVKRSTGANKGKLRFHYEFNYLEIIKQKRAQYAKDGNLFHLNYEKFIKKQIEKRGIHSDSFKLAFALIWALEGGMFLSDTDWNNMLNRKKSFIRIVEPNWDVRAGIDIAKDRASTVITIGRIIPEFVGVPPRKEILQWVELKGMDYELQHQTIVQTLVDYGVSLVYIDYTGVGKPVVDRLTHAIGHFITVVPYTFSRPSKSEMWLALQADILAKRFVIPATQAARDSPEYKNAEIQLKGLTKRYEGGYLVVEKEGENERDDYGDSSALFVMAGNAELTASANVEFSDENPFYQNAGILHTIQTTSW